MTSSTTPVLASAPERLRAPDDLLLPVDRLSRGPLAARAESLRLALSGTAPEAAVEISALLNQVALVFAEAGDFASAERICHAQLALLADRHRSSGDPRLVEAALQPWINLGRLRVLSGDWHGALPHLAMVEAVESRRALWLGPLLIEPDDWEVLLATAPEFRAVVAATEVVDVTKALLRAGRTDVLREQLASWLRSPTTRSSPHVYEGRLVYGLHVGRLADARQLAATVAAHAGGTYTGLVLSYYQHWADVAGTSGYDPQVRDACVALAEAVGGHVDVHGYDHARLAAGAADLLQAVGLGHEATALLRRAADLAASAPDEPLRARLLLRLHAWTGDPTTAVELSRLCADSRYADVRRRVHQVIGCGPHEPYPAFLPALRAQVDATLSGARR